MPATSAHDELRTGDLSWLWCLLLGPIYFLMKGKYRHAVASFALSIVTGALSSWLYGLVAAWLLYPLLVEAVNASLRPRTSPTKGQAGGSTRFLASDDFRRRAGGFRRRRRRRHDRASQGPVGERKNRARQNRNCPHGHKGAGAGRTSRFRKAAARLSALKLGARAVLLPTETDRRGSLRLRRLPGRRRKGAPTIPFQTVSTSYGLTFPTFSRTALTYDASMVWS